jgi:predicted transcriptional regulator
MSQFPSVTDFMATKLVTFQPEMDIHRAVETLLKRKISGAPVLNKNRELIGMLSEVDCLRILLEGPYNEQPAKMGTVADYMSTSVKVISADRTILDAAYEFVHSGYKRLPIIDHKNQLVGQISRVDVLKAIHKLKPAIKHVPDSWRGREPAISNHKISRHSKNS